MHWYADGIAVGTCMGTIIPGVFGSLTSFVIVCSRDWMLDKGEKCAQDDKTAFAQLTVRVRAEHKFAAYNKKGHLVTGDPEAVLPVQDVWIFERSLKSGPLSRWRVAGRLNLPPVPPPKVPMLYQLLKGTLILGRSWMTLPSVILMFPSVHLILLWTAACLI